MESKPRKKSFNPKDGKKPGFKGKGKNSLNSQSVFWETHYYLAEVASSVFVYYSI